MSSFERADHQVMLQTLAEKIHDNRFLRLVGQMLGAGYLEDWVWNATLSGAPQGGVLSPCLSNIYLDRLDRFVDTVLLPEYTRGVRSSNNPEYKRVASAIRRARKRGDYAAARALQKQQRSLPTADLRIPGIGGCGTSGTPMTSSSGSPDRRPKPRRSNVASLSSCKTTSSWNCPKPRR